MRTGNVSAILETEIAIVNEVEQVKLQLKLAISRHPRASISRRTHNSAGGARIIGNHNFTSSRCSSVLRVLIDAGADADAEELELTRIQHGEKGLYPETHVQHSPSLWSCGQHQ